MKTLLAIPSKNRADTLRKNALSWIDAVGYDWRIFLEPQDVEEYNLPMENVCVLSENNKGYGFAKTEIKKFALENNYDSIFKLDDDIKSWTDFRKMLAPKDAGIHLRSVIEKIEFLLQENPRLAGVSFPYSFQMFDRYDFKKTKRVQTAYLFRTNDFYADERVSNFDDFAMSIRAIVNNKMILMCGLTGIGLGVKVGGGTGGQQDFDRMEQSRGEAEVLRELFPLLNFRSVEKRWGIEPDLRSIKMGYYP